MEGAFPHRVFPRRAVLVACAFVAAGALTAPAISSSSALPAANGLVVANTSRGFVLLNASDDSLVARVPGTGPRDNSPTFSPSGRRIAFTS